MCAMAAPPKVYRMRLVAGPGHQRDAGRAYYLTGRQPHLRPLLPGPDRNRFLLMPEPRMPLPGPTDRHAEAAVIEQQAEVRERPVARPSVQAGLKGATSPHFHRFPGIAIVPIKVNFPMVHGAIPSSDRGIAAEQALVEEALSLQRSC